MRVIVSAKVLKTHVGGNTTYAQQVYQGLKDRGHVIIESSPPSFGPQQRRPQAVANALWDGLGVTLSADPSADLIHFPADTGAWFRNSRRRLPLAATLHGVASMHVDGIRTVGAERVWRWRVRRLATLADRIITVSHNSADDLMRLTGRSAADIEVIYHGIDRIRFHPTSSPTDVRVLEDLALPSEFALFLGNLEPRKNIMAAVNAFSEPGSGLPPLVVAGRVAWGAKDLLSSIGRTSRVHYLGPVANDLVAPLIRRSELFVFPSVYEGFGLPVLEAMSCGTPVVAGKGGALKEVAADGAYLLNDTDAAAVRTGAKAVLENSSLKEELIARGLARASSFSWEKSVEAHEAVFESLCR